MDCFGILSINKKILLENKSYYREGVALRMNQRFAFEFLCEKFQPKLINSYSHSKRFFHFLLCDLGSVKNLSSKALSQLLFCSIPKFLAPQKSIQQTSKFSGFYVHCIILIFLVFANFSSNIFSTKQLKTLELNCNSKKTNSIF
jgi:hypothetical protein